MTPADVHAVKAMKAGSGLQNIADEIQAAIIAEREACARLVDEYVANDAPELIQTAGMRWHISAAIRARKP